MNRPEHSPKRVKAGNSQVAAAARKNAFVQAYIANGHNATQAAITAGYSAKTAYSQGQRLLKNVEIGRQLAKAAKEVAVITGLNAQNIIRETARITEFDPARLFREDGATLKNIAEMDDDTRAAIASFEVEESKVDGAVVTRTTKVKFWDKNRAIDMGLRHLGLYEKDNAQTSKPVAIQMVFE